DRLLVLSRIAAVGRVARAAASVGIGVAQALGPVARPRLVRRRAAGTAIRSASRLVPVVAAARAEGAGRASAALPLVAMCSGSIGGAPRRVAPVLGVVPMVPSLGIPSRHAGAPLRGLFGA